jgi:F-type H+-transporting ATPase subunit gamma
MPNLKDIRRRIKSVKNTQKITQAMKMVAAAKVKRAENRVKAARPYAEALGSLLQKVLVSTPVDSLGADFAYAKVLSAKTDAPKTVGVLVISADRGLCGAYHATVLRQLLKLHAQYQKDGIKARYYLVGQKLVQAVKRLPLGHDLLGQLAQVTAAPQVQHAQLVTDALLKAYQTGEVDRIELLSSQFVSMISNRLGHSVMLPLQTATPTGGQTVGGVPSQSAPSAAETTTLLIEPNPAQVLNQIIPMVLTNTVYQAMLEASASELASRMTAMSNATKNAGEMIGRLTIQYNKARQASITQEILEIVSGASALG